MAPPNQKLDFTPKPLQWRHLLNFRLLSWVKKEISFEKSLIMKKNIDKHELEGAPSFSNYEAFEM